MTGPLKFSLYRKIPAERPESGNPRKSLGSLALEIGSLVRVDEVALGSLINRGGESRTGLGGRVFVTGSHGSENALAKRLETALFSAIAFGANDSLTCALDRRFMVGHGR